ncbi:hypothetical protein EUX98_g2894 [Antrodiella citrinella]|uniref:RING-type domain-containing protein n=1 Tax=Antrodiella citrinella TaxID=2447956 RepID=A0A4V3XJ14_9APHY|nr:hypothetical protein EUX98_g2894 [Antrodiella citrinella]
MDHNDNDFLPPVADPRHFNEWLRTFILPPELHDSVNQHTADVQRLIDQTILNLPTLRKNQVPVDDSCGICLQPFDAIVNGDRQETGEGTMTLGSGEEIRLDGITRLEECGHMFCRTDLIEWIKGYHGTCPACRHQFLVIPSAPEDDMESVDDDYVPDPEDLAESDGFTDADDWDIEVEEDMILDSNHHSPILITDDDDDEVQEFEPDMEALMRFVARDSARAQRRRRRREEAAGNHEEGAGEESQENPGLSDSLGSESLSEDEVLAGLTAEEVGTSDNATVYTGESSGSSVHGRTTSQQTK